MLGLGAEVTEGVLLWLTADATEYGVIVLQDAMHENLYDKVSYDGLAAGVLE